MSRYRVLLVDDDPEFVRRFTVFGELSFGVAVARTGEQALIAFERESFDAVLLDIDLGRGLSGLDVLRHLRATAPDLPVLMVSGDERTDTIVEAMKAGANDYVSKTPDLDVLRLKIEKALADGAWREHARTMQFVPGSGLVGDSAAMRRLKDDLTRVAPLNVRVLIRGETGTGKELVATALHAASSRRTEKLLKMNGAVGTDDLFDSDLFGHERGAFTGAADRRRGKLELAHRGTLFFDEIGRMATSRQAKLLRVVETGRFERVGGSDELACDVRLITASNEDLDEAIRGGRFLGDLYYRLAEYTLRVPPLRERIDDIPALARALADRFAKSEALPSVEWDDDALAPFVEHDWPGNVRELDAAIKSAVIMAGPRRLTANDMRRTLAGGRSANPEIGVGDGLAAFVGPDYGQAWQRLQDEFDRLMISRALAATGGVVARAARQLGISRDSLYDKLRRLNIKAREDD